MIRCHRCFSTLARTATAATLLLSSLSFASSANAQAWLSERLNDDSLGYLRLSLTTWESEQQLPIDSLLPLQENSELQTALTSLQAGIDQLFAESEHPQVRSLLRLLITEANGPLELSVYPASAGGPPLPTALLTLPLQNSSISKLNARLNSLAAEPAIRLEREFTVSKPTAVLSSKKGLKILLHFAADEQRLFAKLGLNINEQEFSETRSQLVPRQEPHPMWSQEAELDSSGKGSLVWLNAQAILPLVMAAAPPEKAQKLAAFALIKQFALGFGARDGKGRFGLRVDLHPMGPLAQLPEITPQWPLRLAGKAETAFGMYLPVETLVENYLPMLVMSKGAEAMQRWQAFKAKFKEEVGVDFDQAISSLGPEIGLLSDEAGSFAILRLQKPEVLQQILLQLVSKERADYRIQQRGDTIVHHLALKASWLNQARTKPDPTPVANDDEVNKKAEQSAQLDWLQVLVNRLDTHLYWIEQDGFLVVSGVPQPLIERQAMLGTQRLQEWLSNQQKVAHEHALLMASTEIDEAPKKLYHYYLGGLEMLADLALVELDIINLPTASELGLADSGAYGISLSLDNGRAGLEFSFEQSPADIFLKSNGMVTAVIGGMLAAIAIPAYQDYIVRAEMAEALNSLQQLQAAIADYRQTQGALPQSIDELNQHYDAASLVTDRISISIDQGDLWLRFDAEAGHRQLRNRALRFAPQLNAEGELSWQCYAVADELDSEGQAIPAIKARHLPDGCIPAEEDAEIEALTE